MKKKMEIEALNGWSENAILHAEIENCIPPEENGPIVRRMEAEGRKLVEAARKAGCAENEIRAAVWYPYSEALCGKEGA